GIIGDVQVLQEAVEDTVAAEDRLPSIAANEITDPERNDHELIQKFLAPPRVKGDKVGEWVAEEQREKRDRGRYTHRAKQNAGVQWVRQELLIVIEIPVGDDKAVLHAPETVSEHQGIREQKKEADPE